MKKFEAPQLEVQAFAVVDVITTSTEIGGNAGGPNESERD